MKTRKILENRKFETLYNFKKSIELYEVWRRGKLFKFSKIKSSKLCIILKKVSNYTKYGDEKNCSNSRKFETLYNFKKDIELYEI